MPARGRVVSSTHVDPRAGAPARAYAGRAGPAALSGAARAGISGLSYCAWGAIAATAGFIAMSCWWLSVDRSIPVYDAGSHLEEVLLFHKFLASGNLLGPFEFNNVYPPLGHLVGAVAALVGGVNVSAPIIGENLVFVPLLTLGCYQTGRLLFGPAAGLLAVIFVLGSPLLMAQFHIYGLDGPEAALVAVSMWLILASEDFGRMRIAALAGVAVGAGLMIKLQFPFFVVGLVLAVLLRGGWRNWRGLVLFGGVALLIASPWYLDHLSEFSRVAQIAGRDPAASASSVPPTFSMASFEWYFWSTLNSQLLAPLFVLMCCGSVWLVYALVRGRQPRGIRFEFLFGGFIAWLGITLTRHHDIRYDIPLMPYLAVIATGWMVFMPRALRPVLILALVVAVGFNTLGGTIGAGKPVSWALTHPLPETEAAADQVVFYSNQVFFTEEPQRDGDVPGLFKALRGDGVQFVVLDTEGTHSDFSPEGLSALAFIAGLNYIENPAELASEPRAAGVLYQPAASAGPAPCTRLSTLAGVLVIRANPSTHKLQYYCPFPRPHYYGVAKLN